MSRIQVLLDYPFTATYGEGWGFTRLAGNLQFAERKTVQQGGISVSKLIPTGVPEQFWKVPGLGVLTLAPRFVRYGVVDFDDPRSDAFKQAEYDVTTNADGTSALRIMAKQGTLARTRSQPGPGADVVELLTDISAVAILAEFSSTTSLRTIWATKNALVANEGWRVQVIPVRVPDDPRSKSYIGVNFSSRFFLGISLHGVAELYENIGSQNSPIWVLRRKMDVSGTGVHLREDFSFDCIPIGGRYIVFRFGNLQFKARGARLNAIPDYHEFVYDTDTENTGRYYDADLDQFVALPPGKLSIAVNESGVDYRFTVSKLRYSTASTTAYFTGEPLNNNLPGQTPVVNFFGFCKFTNQQGDPTPDTRTGAGTLSIAYTGASGAAWNPNTDDVLCPYVTMQASTDGIYTPEVWWIEGFAHPTTYTPPYTAQDASDQWTYIRFRKEANQILDPTNFAVKLNEEARIGGIMRRGGPILFAIDGQPVFAGYVDSRKPTLGVRTMEAEYEGLGFEDRLKVPCGKFTSLDGKYLSTVVYRLLRRCGFNDDEILIVDDLGGLTIEPFSEPQSLKIYNPQTLVIDALKDLCEKYTYQGVELLRIRWNGVAWVCSLAPYGASGPDPEIVFSSADVPESRLGDADRWANGWYHITSGLEFDVQRPEYNALAMILTTAAGDGGGKVQAYIAPPPQTLSDPTSQMFEGLYRLKEESTPTVTATTKPGLLVQTRAKYDQDCRKVVGLGVQAEWQPEIDVDLEVAVVGLNPVTQEAVSFGVYRIEGIDAEISADEATSTATGVRLRSWMWSAAYRFLYLRPTSEAFPYPMYDGILPPRAYLTEGIPS